MPEFHSMHRSLFPIAPVPGDLYYDSSANPGQLFIAATDGHLVPLSSMILSGNITGTPGETGQQGIQGNTGPRGSQGDTGPQGPAAPSRVASLQYGIEGGVGGGGATPPQTGAWGTLTVPFNCTITGWSLVGDQSGSAVISIQRAPFSSFPSGGSSITGSDKPTLASQQ